MYLSIHPQNPQLRHIRKAAEILRNGGVIIYPTDTIYGLGCDIHQPQAVQRICRIKDLDPKKARLSFVCYDLSDMSRYVKALPNATFRLMKRLLPGPYTFILPASREVPRLIKGRKDTVGLRVPDHGIARALVKELGAPVLSTSLPGEMVEEYTDPEIIYRHFAHQVDLVIEAGPGGMVPSTVIDCTGEEPVIVRRGLGDISAIPSAAP